MILRFILNKNGKRVILYNKRQTVLAEVQDLELVYKLQEHYNLKPGESIYAFADFQRGANSNKLILGEPLENQNLDW